MADTTKRFFLDDAGVKLLWKKVLERTDGIASDAALTELAKTVAANTQAIKDEATAARAAEEANANAAAAADAKAVAAQGAVDTLAGTHATDKAALEAAIKAITDDYLKSADKTALEEAVAGEKERAEGVEAGLRTDVDAANAAIAILNSDDSVAGSIDKKILDEVAKILNDNDASDIDTLEEIAAWIKNDTAGVGALNAKVDANTNKLAGIDTTVVAAIATAKGEAISAAEADAQGKANTAEANANSYTDAEIAKIVAVEDVAALIAQATSEYEAEKAAAAE
jgi:SWI/SNF-related matrix-associated actin-dependent regulator 1 of chromatin subfamily A